LLVGRIFELPGRPALRRTLHGMLWLAGLTGRRRRPKGHKVAVVGQLYCGLSIDGDILGPNLGAARGMNHDDARDASLGVLRDLTNIDDVALRYRDCSLIDICAQPIWIVLQRVELVWQAINQAYVNSGCPPRMIVEDPVSVESDLARAVEATNRRPIVVATRAGIHSLQPYWSGSLVASCMRLLAFAWALSRDARLPACHVRLGPAGAMREPGDFRGEPLFLSFGAVSTRASLSVIWRFLETKELPVNVILPRRLEKFFVKSATERGYLCGSPRRVGPPGLLRSIWHFRAAGKVRRSLKRSGVHYHGSSVARLLDGGLSLFSMSSFPVVRAHMDVWQAELSTLRPAVIVTGNNYDWRFKAVAALAKKMEIPTLNSLDGFGVESALFSIGGAQYQCAVSEEMATSMRNRGVPSEAIHVVGLPKYDRLARLNSESPVVVPENLYIDLQRTVIVVTSHHYIDRNTKEKMIRCILEVAAEHPNFQFVFKLHPDERDGLVASIIEEFGLSSTVQVCRDVDVIDVLLLASVVAVFGASSCGVEAIALKKPTLIIDFSGRRLQLPYLEDGAALGVERASEFSPALFRVLNDEITRARLAAEGAHFVARYLGRVDGLAAERTITLLDDLARSKARVQGQRKLEY
jgi:hypothetical protein